MRNLLAGRPASRTVQDAEPPRRDRNSLIQSGGGPPWSLDLGANVAADGTRFRVWAPDAMRVDVQVEGPAGPTHHPLARDDDGYHAAMVAGVRAGDRYRYRLDGGQAYPDPCSRSQPAGPHGPSLIVDPSVYRWGDAGWVGLDPDRLVIYELHVGTFTPEGTFDAIVPRLSELWSLGVTAIELMPVAEFPGRWNWGYDGVDLYAPSSIYGGSEGLRRLVDAAHAADLGVLLDVVYNHFGPDGNYLRAYAEAYFTDRHKTPWGDAVNYGGRRSEHVRHFVLQNARHWLHEYHLDGLRLDATHAILDDSARHILAELADLGRSRPGRRAILIAEDGRNDVRLVRRGQPPLVKPPRSQEAGLEPPGLILSTSSEVDTGYGLDGVWADDFHHTLRTYLTGEREGYYAAYSGRLEDVARAIEEGFLYQGQVDPTTGHPRGTPVTDEPARAFVFCTENHDQVGNRAFGERLAHLVDRDRYLVAAAVLLLAPETPLLFQGQELAATAPFLYFTDHTPELGRLVTEGRRAEFGAFSAFADPARRAEIPDPQAESTFLRSKLDWSERYNEGSGAYHIHRELLALRHQDPVLSRPDRQSTRARAVGEHLLALHRWQDSERRLLLANFGDAPGRLDVIAASALAIPSKTVWRGSWTTPGPRSLPSGEVNLESLKVPPRSALILSAGPAMDE